jgi:hypothetical protein
MEILSQGLFGTCKGWYRPYFLFLGMLVQNSIHPLIYHATYSYILGQYTYLCKLEIVFPKPKCLATLEV